MPDVESRGGVPPPLASGSPEVLSELKARIKEKGPITFREFMEVALFLPEGGYYTSIKETWGRQGDYITSLDVSPVFSATLAREVVEAWEILGSPEDFVLLEAGAGRGLLSTGILDSLKRLSPELYGSIRVEFVEKNPHLRKAPAGNVSWRGSLEEVSPFTGCIITNELIDSFPVYRVVCDNGLKEVYVGLEKGAFMDLPGPLSTPELSEYFKEISIEPFDGMVAEVNLEALKWIESAGRLLKRGFIVTIDYGLPAQELYSPERRGSLLCHFKHTINDNPYINVGTQDITTHVDFTSLVIAGRKAGLELMGFTTQKNFLLGLGILEELKVPDSFGIEGYDKISFNRALARLIAPGGMGDAFKVLIQGKGVGKRELKGFSFKDMSRALRA